MKEFRMFFLLALFVATSVLVAFAASFFFRISSANVAIIPIDSPIGLSDSLFSGLASDDIIGVIEQAESNPNVEVIILSIDSGGGSVVACQEVVEKVKLVEKPIIAWIRDAGASGAYWIASATDYIVASPLSITGSIGVTASYLDYSGLFEKYGINYWNFTMPESKDIFTSYREPTKEEQEIIMEIVNISYNYLIDDVSLNRNLTREFLIENTKAGAVISGEEAFEIGLVDYLGGRETVIALAKEVGNLEYVETEIYQKEVMDLLSTFLSGFNKLIVKA